MLKYIAVTVATVVRLACTERLRLIELTAAERQHQGACVASIHSTVISRMKKERGRWVLRISFSSLALMIVGQRIDGHPATNKLLQLS